MPIKLGIVNSEHVDGIAATLNLPAWLVEALIVEYLSCRRFLEDDTSILFDFGRISVQNVESIANPYIIISNITLFHNVNPQVFKARMLHGIAGMPLSTLAEHPYLSIPEGKASPSYIPFILNPLTVVDWKLDLNSYAVVYDKETSEIFQWNLISIPTDSTNSLAQFDPSLAGFNPEIFTLGQPEKLRGIRQKIFELFSQESYPIDVSALASMRDSLERAYEELENLWASMRAAILDYHRLHKDKPEARRAYTEDSPPLLTIFDQFDLPKVDEGPYKRRKFKVRTYIERLFFSAANRAASTAEKARARINTEELTPIIIAEEIEAAAESIILSATCLEAYINGFVEDHIHKSKSLVKRMELTAKWLFVPALLGKPDCFDTSNQPFQNFATLIRWRNDDLAHYKHEFQFPEPLGELGDVSKIYFICNADNSRMAVDTVRNMISRINEYLGLPIPAWIEESKG